MVESIYRLRGATLPQVILRAQIVIASWLRLAFLLAILPSLRVIVPSRAQGLPVTYRAAIGFQRVEGADP